MVWHEIIYSICVGAFISGAIFTIILMLLSASNLSQNASEGIDDSSDGEDLDTEIEIDTEVDFDSEIEVNSDFDTEVEVNSDFDTEVEVNSDFDTEVEVDYDFDTEVEVDCDFDTEVEVDCDFDTEIEIDTEVDLSIGGNAAGLMSDVVSYANNTPVSLIFSLYLLWMGAIGTFSYDVIASKLFWMSLVLIIPVGITKLVSRAYQKVAQNQTYRVRVKDELLGREATVKIDVDHNGGVVSIKTPDSVQQIGAKSLFPLAYFYSGDTVFVCAYHDGIYYIDSNPKNVRLHHGKKGKKSEPKSKHSQISNFHQAAISPQR